MKIVIVAQEKGGTGKSLVTQGVAALAPTLQLFEVEFTERLLGYAGRKTHFRVKATNDELEASGGAASLEEFDPLIDAIAQISGPVIIDVGANTATAVFSAISNVQSQLRDLKIEIATLMVVTNEPGALAAIPALIAASDWAAARFLVENRLHNEVAPEEMARLSIGAVVTELAQHRLAKGASAILNAAGVQSIENLDPVALGRAYGLSKASRIERDLTRLKLDLLRAVEPATQWLVS
jgi:hypothetical protein